MEKLLGEPSPAGGVLLFSMVVAGVVFILEGHLGVQIGGTLTLTALYGSLVVAVACGYVGGGYPMCLFSAYLPFVGSGFAFAMTTPSISVTSHQIYHLLWSLGVFGIIMASIGFLVGAGGAGRLALRADGRAILFVCAIGATVAGLLWLTCSPFSTASCGTIEIDH